MHNDLAHHTSRDIQQVATGLAMVVGTDAAAEELRRLYGEQRATDAIVLLARRTRADRKGLTAEVRAVPTRPTASRPAAGPRPSRALTARSMARPPLGSRGTRPGDWL
ncbi:hypothetical protein BH23ACT9_BH23ACT9_16930 [soil metagenome]